jgi:hypothetical protein
MFGDPLMARAFISLESETKRTSLLVTCTCMRLFLDYYDRLYVRLEPLT